jgi:homocysteine S-methyltransferase
LDRNTFRALIATGPILCDGGTGASLAAAAGPPYTCFDALNLDDARSVVAVHHSFVQAGARIVEANTFGANRFKLADHRLAGLVEQINHAGVRLAREAGAEFVAGSVGPLGVRLVPYGRVRRHEAREAFQEQISALAESGADLLIVETQTDTDEAEQAVVAARSVCSLPVVVSFTFTRDDCTLLGETPGSVARRLRGLDVDALGVNCSEGPAQVLRLLLDMRTEVGDLPLAAMPNAGGPHRLGGRVLYQATPRYLAEYATRFRDAGVSLIGGCCGTGATHVAEMAVALSRTRPGSPPAPRQEAAPRRPIDTGTRALPAPAAEAATGPSDGWLAAGRFTFVVEMAPPRAFSTARLVAAADTLAKAGAHAISVADSPMARMRMSPWAACHLIQREAGVATILHFPTRGRSILRIQGDLLASYALGIRSLFVCLGDPAAIGDYPQASDQADVTASGLIALVKRRLNAGIDRAGASIGDATSFVVGCALDLNAQDPDREVRVLHRKVTAGADFVLTQPIFSVDVLRSFLHRYENRFGPLQIPALVGLLPLVTSRHAEFLHNEVPGISVPEHVRERIGGAGDQGEREGLNLASELGSELRRLAGGAYLIPPFGRFDIAAEVIERVKVT